MYFTLSSVELIFAYLITKEDSHKEFIHEYALSKARRSLKVDFMSGICS